MLTAMVITVATAKVAIMGMEAMGAAVQAAVALVAAEPARRVAARVSPRLLQARLRV